MSASTEHNQLSGNGHKAGLSLILLATLLVAFIAAWPIISEPGFLNTRGGGDSPFLLQRLQQMEVALRDGHFPVRWMRDANYGFGYPFYNYYAPLSIYVAALFRLLGFSLVRSLESAQLLGFLLAAAGTFLLARRWYRHEWAALLASVAYTTAPFHLVNVYVRGDSLAEFWAMAFYPWVVLTADRLFDANGQGVPAGRVVALALAYAALVLSHNISVLIFTPFLILFVFLRWLLRESPVNETTFSLAHLRELWPPLAAGLLGLALAAWFFIPALVEQHFAQLGPVTEGYFSFTNHFRGQDLVQSSLLFDFDVSGGNAFRMGLVQALAAFLGSLALIYARFKRHVVAKAPALFILLTLAISTLMITSLSRVLWEIMPLLSFTQFPWRFLSIQAFAAALAIGALALLPYCRTVAIATAVVLIVSSFAALQTDHLLLTDEDITPDSLAQYEWFTGNIGSTVSAEYLPQTVQPRFYTSAWLNASARANARALTGDLLAVKQTVLQTDRQSWSVQVGDGGAMVVFPTMAWPGWTAAAGGRSLQIQEAPGSGHIMLDIPPGDHTVDLTFERTDLRRGAEMFSFGAAIIALFLLFKAVQSWRPDRTTMVVGIALLVFLVLFRFWPERRLSNGTLTWDFAQMAYLHHDEDGVPYNSGTTLLNYEYDRETLSAGESVSLTLSFAEANDDVVTVTLGSPALVWPAFSPEPPLMVTQSKRLDSERITFDLQVPENAPAGLIIPRVRMKVGRPLMPSGRLRGDLFLRPLQLINDRPAGDRKSPLEVEIAEVHLRDPQTLDVRLVWSTEEPLSHNYNASLLLIDGAGNWLAQLDTQPGYGFLPSSEWEPGKAIDDWLALDLSASVPQENTLALVVRLYEVNSGHVVLTRRLGEVMLQGEKVNFTPNQPRYSLPESLSQLTAQFGEHVQLQGYNLERVSEGSWQLKLYWQALGPDREDALRFVHVLDPRTEEIIFQSDSHPRGNSYPLSQWSEGEIVTDSLTIRLDEAPSGEYEIAVGFYHLQDDGPQRLAAIDPASGQPFTADRVLLPQTINHFGHR